MNPQLIAACQMFLLPASILFTAVGIARTEALKTLISAMGLGISIVWILCVWTWEGVSLGDTFIALALAIIFFVAAIISVFVHGSAWKSEGNIAPVGLVDRHD